MNKSIGFALGAVLLLLPASLPALQRGNPPTQQPPPTTGSRGLPPTTGQGQRGATPPAGRAGQTPDPQTPADPQAVFRAGTVLVPLDIRVTDRATGKPVTDLRREEFLIFENSTRQQIQFFSTQSLVADATIVASPLVRANAAPTALGPQTRRTFLIVLGRGRLQPVTKAVDGMLHLIKERLLPQDYVAVMAWNRATEFTTDHAKIAALLERYLKQHEKVEALMAQQFAGLAARYGGGYMPKAIQSQVDAVFFGPDMPKVRTVADTAVPDATRMAVDRRQTSDALMTNEINANREPGTFLTDPFDASSGLEMSFDEYVSANAQTNQDLNKIYAGINYMRYLDGEKHLVFISERGLFLPRAEDDKGLAAQAADARVAIDIMHTGGIIMPPMRMGGAGGRAGGRGVAMPAMGAMAADWRVSTSQTVAEQTGGTFSGSMKGKEFADKLDDSTRFSYLLGYTPTNTNWNGAYRKVQVRLTRPGAGRYKIDYRRGYFSETEIRPLDKPKALAYSRVVGAANSAVAIPDIGLTVTVNHATTDDGAQAVEIAVKIKPDQLGFIDKDGKKKGSIDIAIFCADDKERLLGESWNTVELEMTPEAFAKFQANGLNYGGKVPVRGIPRFVKVIVYDLGADVLGSSITKLDPPKAKK